MKQIGWTIPGQDDWLKMVMNHEVILSPMSVALYIPEPGEREQINAEQYRHVGWIDMNVSQFGSIFETHAGAGPESRPAYVRIEDLPKHEPASSDWSEPASDLFATVPKYGETGCKPASDSDNMTAIVQLNKRLDDLEAGTQPLMPGEEQQNDMSDAIEKLGLKRSMGVLFARLELHSTRLEKLEEICRPDLVAHGVLSPGAAAKLAMSKEYGEISRPLPSTIPTSELLSEATEFCNEELDRFDGLDFDSDAEVGCQRSATYIRELVRRFPAEPAPVSAPLDGLTGTELSELRAAVSTLEAKLSTLARIQQHGALYKTDQPMTFYDHAFIACAVHGILTGSKLDEAVRDAHKLARHFTRNRANQP